MAVSSSTLLNKSSVSGTVDHVVIVQVDVPNGSGPDPPAANEIDAGPFYRLDAGTTGGTGKVVAQLC